MLLTALLLTLFVSQDPHQTMNDRGAKVMGFDQEQTAHHFYLYDDGGAIEVQVRAATNTKDRDAIRSHLPHISMMFADGNFDAPMLVHDAPNVPGTAVMAARKDKITYKYVDMPAGGRVNIVTTDRDALAAVHAFLKYQIVEHMTGDSVTPGKRK